MSLQLNIDQLFLNIAFHRLKISVNKPNLLVDEVFEINHKITILYINSHGSWLFLPDSLLTKWYILSRDKVNYIEKW